MSIGRIRKKSHYQYVARNGVKFVPTSRDFMMQGARAQPPPKISVNLQNLTSHSKNDPLPIEGNETDQAKLPISKGNVRFGFIVTRKNGSAVMRNRIRRRLKEACRIVVNDSTSEKQSDIDVVIIGHRSAADIPFLNLVKDVIASLSRIRAKLAAK